MIFNAQPKWRTVDAQWWFVFYWMKAVFISQIYSFYYYHIQSIEIEITQ